MVLMGGLKGFAMVLTGGLVQLPRQILCLIVA